MKNLIAALLIAGSPANAFTGEDLYDLCGNSTEGDAPLGCIAYIRGFVDGIRADRIEMGRRLDEALVSSGREPISHQLPYPICIPPASTADQASQVLRTFLSENPNSWHERADFVTYISLMLAFPCE